MGTLKKERMKLRIITLIFLLTLTNVCFGQVEYCYEVVKDVKLPSSGNIIKKSKTDMTFKMSDGIESQLQIAGTPFQIGNKTYSFTLEFNLTFVDSEKMPSITGEILTINFADGYTIDLTPKSKFISTGTAFFNLVNKKLKGDLLSIPDNEKVLYEKLLTVDISSFKYNVDNKNRNITVTKENAAIIRRIIKCVNVE